MVLDRDTRPDGLVVQSFASESDAEAALLALRDAGFSPDAVSVMARDEGRAREVADDTGADTATGAGIGAATGAGLGALGGLLVGATALAIPGIGIVVAGPLAAVLGGAGVGGVTGGLAGALAALGVSDDDAKRYEERLEAGDIVIAVAAGDRERQAWQILHGGTYGRAGMTPVADADTAVDRGTERTVIVRPEP